ncbi:MAG: Asp-tRNA(Asn)/Glu-tRNA(Gln) amidotransferase subunit GatA [Deltaproteobacteria bacterium]|nr:Asp-tRNA(Asn)/Glu-tRNA(Gln) amidotransferase subunit GatA [Deltaproteobacteria bacterium]
MLDIARRFRVDNISPLDITEEILQGIKQDPLNAYITVDETGARNAAKEAEEEIRQGSDNLLLGVPVAIKDNICTKGVSTTCASNILSNFVPTYDAHVVEKLKNSGVVIVGKTNMDEFAMGSTTTTSKIGPTKNPWDITKTPGGSSGGSAAAVAADLCAASLGSDTGGSIRQPASFCGITGLKPTYGSVSRFGLVAFASSLDQIGPMARSARDVAILYNAVKGYDPKDSTSVAMKYQPTSLDGLDMRGIRVGVPGAFFGEGLSTDVEKAVKDGISVFKELGAEIVDIDLAYIRYGVAVYYIVATAEASSNLARYDGVRYGLRGNNADDLIDMYIDTRSSGFNIEVKRRIMLGTYGLSAGYYDQYYRKASQVRTLIIQDFAKAFEVCDIIIGPTTPTPAFGLYEMIDDPLSLYLLDIYTIPANLTGLPALSIPCGFTKEGLPIGMQLMAPAFREDILLGAGISFQDHTRFHEKRPQWNMM